MARGGKGIQYPQDFKNTAIKLAITGDKQIKEVAEELHIHYKTLSTWVLQYKKEHFVVDKQDEKSGKALIVATADGSNTLYSQKYSQNFHSCKDGATNESLYKHIIPALNHHTNKDNLRILDICFGLGYNTFLTILENKKSPAPKKIEIISPELDGKLVRSLKDFSYPDEFQSIKNIIAEVSENKFYEDNFLKITVLIEEAREVVKNAKNIDIVYQDAFSSDTNRELWSVEYFYDIKKAMNLDGILTTYSVATPVRLSLFENDFLIYENKSEFCRRGTLAFLEEQNIDNFVDMRLKKTRNPDAKPIFD